MTSFGLLSTHRAQNSQLGQFVWSIFCNIHHFTVFDVLDKIFLTLSENYRNSKQISCRIEKKKKNLNFYQWWEQFLWMIRTVFTYCFGHDNLQKVSAIIPIKNNKMFKYFSIPSKCGFSTQFLFTHSVCFTIFWMAL